jgi:hypothetical protein
MTESSDIEIALSRELSMLSDEDLDAPQKSARGIIERIKAKKKHIGSETRKKLTKRIQMLRALG